LKQRTRKLVLHFLGQDGNRFHRLFEQLGRGRKVLRSLSGAQRRSASSPL
jgi:hypothetical protein